MYSAQSPLERSWHRVLQRGTSECVPGCAIHRGTGWQVQNDSRGGCGEDEGNPNIPRQRKQPMSGTKDPCTVPNFIPR